MDAMNTCSGCSKPLDANTAQGLCPECLLRAGLGTGVEISLDSRSQAEGRKARFTAPAPGELAGMFPQLEILELIGQGGMGAVYRVRQKALDRVAALKILPPGIGGDPAFAERFVREAKALAKLNHPNIVTLYEFGQAGDLFFFLMEFVDGMNLREVLHAGKITPKEALAIVPHICDALQFAHDRGIVHRDIKPENILLGKDGQVKIADFGVAKLMARESAEPTAAEIPECSGEGTVERGRVVGTPQYMAPEQVSHPAAVDHRADIYSLGVVFYQMLTGELPGVPLSPPSRRIQVDVRIDEIVLRALEQEPERRYQQASEVKTEVETFAGIAAAPAAGAVAGQANNEVAAQPRKASGPGWLVAAALSVVLFASMLLGVVAALATPWGGGLHRAAFALSLAALPFSAAIAHRSVWRWRRAVKAGETPHDIHWLRAWGWLAWLLALPVGGFGLFLLDAMLSETGGWHPVPNEVVIAPLTWLGALLLLLSGWILLRASGSYRKPEDWRTWSPFQSPLVREIYDHMTEAERREGTRRRAMFGVWLAATWFGSLVAKMLMPLLPGALVGPIILLVGIAGIPVWRRMQREYLCATGWARQQSLQPDQLTTAEIIVLVGRRGGKAAIHWIGVLWAFVRILAGAEFGALYASLYLFGRIDSRPLGIALLFAVVSTGNIVRRCLRIPVDQLTPLDGSGETGPPTRDAGKGQDRAAERLRKRRGVPHWAAALVIALLLLVFAFPIGWFALRYASSKAARAAQTPPSLPLSPREAVPGVVDATPGTRGLGSSDYVIQGGRLTQEEVTALEGKMEQQPDDLETRRLLLRCYSSAQYKSPEARKKHAELALWFIRNHPEDSIAGDTTAGLNPVLDGAAYAEGRALWVEHVRQNPTDLVILSHAVAFSQIYDLDFAETCLKKCVEVAPAQPEWHKKLAFFYALHADGGAPEAAGRATKALAELETAMGMMKDSQERLSQLEYAAQYAYKAGAYDKAKTYATELLASASALERWDYGNGIHYGNIVLGRLALRGGDVAAAKRYLIEAGKTPGSPQLNSFGPNMDLAKELVERGEKAVVLEYLDLCNKFWDASCQNDNGGEKSIAWWKRAIAESGVLATPALPPAVPRPAPSATPLPPGAVELIAVTSYPSAPGQPWWRPDGSPFAGTPLESGGNLPLPENRDFIAREFAIGCPDLPADASRPVYKIETPDGGVRYGSQTVSEQPSKGLYGFPVQLRRTNRAVDMSIGFASGEWRTVARKAPGWGGGGLVDFEGNRWEVRFLQEQALEDGVCISVVYTVPDDWQVDVVAVDQDGKQHKSEWAATGAGGFSTLEVKFPGLPLAQVKEFCFEVRPYQWTEFKDVALYPAGGAESPVASGKTPDVSEGEAGETRPTGSEEPVAEPEIRVVVFSLRHCLASQMAEELAPILQARPGQKAIPTADGAQLAVAAPPSVLNRVTTFITVQDWPVRINRAYGYPRDNVEDAARSFFHACSVEDIEGAGRMLTPRLLAELKGVDSRPFVLQFSERPTPELIREVCDGWAGKDEAVRKLVETWNRYPLTLLHGEPKIAVGFGPRYYVSVAFEGAPTEHWVELSFLPEIETGAKKQGPLMIDDLPPWFAKEGE